jgi:hypothetical protein
MSALDKMKILNRSGYISLLNVAILACLYATYSSSLLCYDINHYKNPQTDNNIIEIGRYSLNLLFVMISVYILITTNVKFNIDICKHDTKNLGKTCSPFTFSINYLLVFFTMVYLYDAVITILVYHRLIKDVVLIKKLKIASISLNILIIVLSINYLREFVSN